MPELEILQCDFSNPKHREAVILLLNHYMSGPMGGFLPPHDNDTAQKVIEGLEKHPSKLVLLAKLKTEYVGMTVGYVNFATFSARPFINIHDVIVQEKYRGNGIGNRLFEEIILYAQKMNCGKITLEVREDNFAAQRLYKKFGFHEGAPPMRFWSKYF